MHEDVDQLLHEASRALGVPWYLGRARQLSMCDEAFDRRHLADEGDRCVDLRIVSLGAAAAFSACQGTLAP